MKTEGTTAADRAKTGRTEAILIGLGLSKLYGDLQVLSQVDFSVGTSEAVGVVGPNGAGKTTLLSVLAGSVTPSAGTVRLDGNDVTGLRPELRCRRGIGRAFQIPRPFGGMTVLENVLVRTAYGAGKSTLLRTIAGAHSAAAGTIRLDGTDITEVPPHRRVARGLALVPEGRKLFPEMTVEENLLVAGRRARPGTWTIDTVLNAFPMWRA